MKSMIKNFSGLGLLLGLSTTLFALIAARVDLVYETQIPAGGHGTMDSIEIWVAPDPSESLLLITDKTYGFLEVHNANSNKYIGRIGGSGQLNYPNGVAVAYDVETGNGTHDVAFAVERDANRVSAFSLPDGDFLGSWGTQQLEEPYGIEIYYDNGKLQTWITSVDSRPNMVFIYDIKPAGNGIDGDLAGSFPTHGDLESILIDPYHKEVYLCDESDEKNIMIYDLQGNLKGRFGEGLFTEDPEGIQLYDMGQGKGWIIVADQNADPTQYEIFERGTLKYLGFFTGETGNTDGLTLTQYALPNFPHGGFFPINSDKHAHAYDWKEIANQTGLGINMLERGTTGIKEQTTTQPPADFTLSPAYPNPFTPNLPLLGSNIRIPLSLAKSQNISAKVYNVRGQLIKTLAEKQRFNAGSHELIWNGLDANHSQLPNGVYLIRVATQRAQQVTKVTLAR